jgi:hypothetical protein
VRRPLRGIGRPRVRDRAGGALALELKLVFDPAELVGQGHHRSVLLGHVAFEPRKTRFQVGQTVVAHESGVACGPPEIE